MSSAVTHRISHLKQGTYLGEQFLHWRLQDWIEKSAPSWKWLWRRGQDHMPRGICKTKNFAWSLRRGDRHWWHGDGCCQTQSGQTALLHGSFYKGYEARSCSLPAQTGLSIHSIPFCSVLNKSLFQAHFPKQMQTLFSCVRFPWAN